MKKLIAILLAALMLVVSLSVTCYAEDAQFLYSDEDIEVLYSDFSYVSTMVETMYGTDAAVAYWKYAHNMEKKSFASWLIDASTKILGEHPDKKFYLELLVNMITAMEVGAAAQIENQGSFDNLKGARDYALDLIDIGANIIGLEGKIKPLEKAIGVASDALNLTTATLEEVKFYEAIVKNYAVSELFLAAIADNTDNATLRSAANELRNATSLLFKQRISVISNVTDDTLFFSAKNFGADLSFSIMKNLDDYKTDPYLKDIVDFGETAFNSILKFIDTGKTIFNLVMLGGDLVLGTTNTFKRHNEMDAMADIADALVKAYKSVTISPTDTPQSIYSNIFTKCEYYKMLLSTHLRGEYLIYQLNYNDAGLLSAMTQLLDSIFKNDSNSIGDWYDKQTKTCEEYYNMVVDLFDGLLQPPTVIEDDFELYNGFIVPVEQQTTVPDGYIGVYSFADLKKIADSCPSSNLKNSNHSIKTEFNTAKYILMNDITCPAEYDYAAIFYGVIDGNGYTIHNISQPLFARISNATIKNLGMEVNCIKEEDMMKTEYSFGAIAQYAQTLDNPNESIIDNCFTKGSVDITCRSGDFGMLIGSASNTTISNCYNEANIRIKTRQASNLGGLTGIYGRVENCFNKGSVSLHTTCKQTANAQLSVITVGGIKGYQGYSDSSENCFNAGTVSGSTDIACNVHCGGIVGFNYGSGDFDIERCYNYGKVSNNCTEAFDVNGTYGTAYTPFYTAGGIVGHSASANVTKCWNSGEISSKNFAGGICGSIYTTGAKTVSDSYNVGHISALCSAGGIIGYSGEFAAIKCCYNTGSVSSSLYSGAIAGSITKGENAIKSCYFLDNGLNATGAGTNYSGATKINATQLKDKNTFTDFDFAKVWRLKDGDPAPTIRK